MTTQTTIPQPRARTPGRRGPVALRLAKRAIRPAYHFVARTYAHYRPVIDLAGTASNTVLVAGTPRSGTTWVGDVIAAMIRARSLFEPMLLNTAGEFVLCRTRYLNEDDLQRRFQLYIRPDAGDRSPYYAPLRAILEGRARGKWCDRFTPVGVYYRRLIKEVRANLFLTYLAETWPELKIIWLVRHPFAVINSQIEMSGQEGWGFDWSPDCILTQAEVVTDWLAPFASGMTGARDFAARLAHKWCIETYIPLQQKLHERPNVVLVRYENLKQGLSAWQQIARLVSTTEWDPALFERVAQKPSPTSQPGASGKAGQKGRYPHLDEATRERILRIVAEYGLEALAPV